MCDYHSYQPAPPPTPALDLLKKSAMEIKRLEADKLEERKRVGEYMAMIRETMKHWLTPPDMVNTE